MHRLVMAKPAWVLLLASLVTLSGCRLGEPKVLLAEDFDACAQGPWSPTGAWTGVKVENWTVAGDGNKYLQADNKGGMVGTGDESWTNLTLAVLLRPGNAAEHGIAVRYNPGYDDYYELCLTVWRDGKGVIKLWKIVDGYIQPLAAEVPFAYDFSTFYRLKMTVRGARIKCYVGDRPAPVIDCTDRGKILGAPLRRGKIGLYTEGGAAFDDVLVTR